MKRESTITREHRAALVSVGQHAARGVGPQYTEARLAHGERHALGHRHATLSYPTTRPANHFPHADVTTHPPPVTVIVDTREHDVPAFDSWVRVERAGLGEGDFTTPLLWGTAVIERKNPDDFHKSFFSDDRDNRAFNSEKWNWL